MVTTALSTSSQATVDAEVVDVIDVTEEEAREERRRAQQQGEDMAGKTSYGQRRPAAEIAKDVRDLAEEAMKLVREAGPRAVGIRGISASR